MEFWCVAKIKSNKIKNIKVKYPSITNPKIKNTKIKITKLKNQQTPIDSWTPLDFPEKFSYK